MDTVKVAWVTHRDPFSRLGGAEAGEMDMMSQRPEGVDIMLVKPGGVDHDLEDFDAVIASGLWGFSEWEINVLSKCKNLTTWAFDVQLAGHWLYGQSRLFIAQSPGHLEYEEKAHKKLDKVSRFALPGYFDTAGMEPGVKDGWVALWAHRPVWEKGLYAAHVWAAEQEVELDVLINQPHERVIEYMKKSAYFILLSGDKYDAGPRAIMEAQLCGCQLIVTENVGIWDAEPDELRELIQGAPKIFWEAVLS